MQLKNIYTQSSDKPHRFSFVGQYDLPNKLSNRALSNLPFKRWGIKEDQVVGMRYAIVNNEQSLVIMIVKDQSPQVLP